MLHGNKNYKLVLGLLFISFFIIVNLVFAEVSNNVYMIPLPNPCAYVVKVEKGKVFLGKRGEVCTQVLSVTSVKVDPDDEGYITIYYEGKVWKKLKVKGNIEDLMSYVDEVSKGFSLGNLKQNPYVEEEVKKRLEEISAYYFSEEFKQKVEKEKERISKILLPQSFGKEEGAERFYETGYLKRGSLLNENERLYVFISKSVPEDTIRAFVKRAELLGSYEQVFFVLRGGIEGLTRLRPTVEWVAKMIVKNLECFSNLENSPCEIYRVKFIIDPLLFRRYRISEVPAVVYVKGIQPQFGYSEGFEEVKVEKFYVSYGDADLMYHLYVIGNVSGEKKFVDFSSQFLRN